MKNNLSLWNVLKKVLPLEIVAYTMVIAAMILVVMFQLTFYIPSVNTVKFIANHYVGPLVPGLIVSSVIAGIFRRDKPTTTVMPRMIIDRIRIVIAFVVVVYIHFNLKLWAQLINSSNFDAEYYRIDQVMSPIVAAMSLMSVELQTIFHLGKINAYHDVFVGMFILSFSLHAMYNKKFEEVIIATALVLGLGGLSYIIAPAFGPFIFERGVSATAAVIQQYMLDFYRGFIGSNGGNYNSVYFASAVAAMPSLHIANAAVFTYYAWKEIRWLGIVYLVLITYLTVEAVASRWHYLVDIPAGLAVTAIAIYIARFLIKQMRGRVSHVDARESWSLLQYEKDVLNNHSRNDIDILKH